MCCSSRFFQLAFRLRFLHVRSHNGIPFCKCSHKASRKCALNVTCHLQHLTDAMVKSLPLARRDKPPELLKALTKPLTKLVIQIDKKVLKGWSLGQEKYVNVTTLLKISCKRNVSTRIEPAEPHS